MPGEFDFISWLRDQAPAGPAVPIGIGDDLAALRLPAGDLVLVGIDQVLDGVHFDSAVHGPRQIGRKAVNRNLSDCAAMACLPAAAVLSLALPRGCGADYAKQIYLGARDAGDAEGCPIVGGDTGSWPGPLAVTVAVVGRSGGIAPVTRGGARVGDGLYVTGPLGGSLTSGRHLSFAPRVSLARDLAARFRLHAMADVSDGLLRDLRNVCVASGVGAEVDARLVPVHDDVSAVAPAVARSIHAMTDGEDHELLIASPDELPRPCVRVGTVTPDGFTMTTVDGRTVRGWPAAGGWEHAL